MTEESGNGQQQQAGDGEPKTFTQEQVNALLADQKRKVRESFADYDDLKTKAGQLDQLAQASKSESDKLNERIEALERENETVKAGALRSRIQAKFSISDDDAELFLTGADEESLTKQAERLAQRESERKKQGNRVAREGNNSTPKANDEREFVRNLFGSGD